jgi:DNA polymerase-3 subunit beta
MNKENYYVKMKAGKSEFNLHGLSAEEFPSDSVQLQDSAFLIAADHFRDSLFQTQFAVSHDESRPVFTGILIEKKDEKIVFVATDGYRLAVKYSDIALNADIPSVILPGKAAAEIFRLSSGKDFDDIKMDISDTRIIVQFPDTLLTSRLIEGQFPNYKQIIPKSHPINIEMDREEFLHTIERVGLITKEGPNIIRIHITKDQKMIITARSPEIGDTYDEIDIGFVDTEIRIAFNVKYLTDVLKVLSDEKIVFSLTEELKPASIRPVDSNDYEYIVLPVRLPQ